MASTSSFVDLTVLKPSGGKENRVFDAADIVATPAMMVLHGLWHKKGHKADFHRKSEFCKCLKISGERGRNRTFNLLIKSQLLCQLSYAPFKDLRVKQSAAVSRSH